MVPALVHWYIGTLVHWYIVILEHSYKNKKHFFIYVRG